MKLFYRQFGNGESVVLLHGLLGVSDNWVTFARQLGASYSVFVPDLRNHGQSPHSDMFNLASLEDDVMELIDTLGLEEVYIIGHSLGGKIGMFFSLNHPDRVKKLVVVDIGLRKSLASMEHLQLIDAMGQVDFSKAKQRSDVDKQLARSISSLKLRQFLLKNVYWRDRNMLDWRFNLKAINENLLSIFDVDTPTGFYPGPVLFIRGGNSNYILDEDVPEIITKFPGATVRTIVNVSHWVHADAPGEFFTLVKEFLDG
ncbi:MAG: alpha/beta fold hydrolase [Bacteroidales bacterium]|nr:alpha/beta fold hydrolase [Bacteroidales bacterium]